MDLTVHIASFVTARVAEEPPTISREGYFLTYEITLVPASAAREADSLFVGYSDVHSGFVNLAFGEDVFVVVQHISFAEVAVFLRVVVEPVAAFGGAFDLIKVNVPFSLLSFAEGQILFSCDRQLR
jgi:hypothetical protein